MKHETQTLNTLEAALLAYTLTQLPRFAQSDWALVINRNMHRDIASRIVREFSRSIEARNAAEGLSLGCVARTMSAATEEVLGLVELHASKVYEGID